MLLCCCAVVLLPWLKMIPKQCKDKLILKTFRNVLVISYGALYFSPVFTWKQHNLLYLRMITIAQQAQLQMCLQKWKVIQIKSTLTKIKGWNQSDHIKFLSYVDSIHLKLGRIENLYCSKWLALLNDKRSRLDFFNIAFSFGVIHWFQVATDDVILFVNFLDTI